MKSCFSWIATLTAILVLTSCSVHKAMQGNEKNSTSDRGQVTHQPNDQHRKMRYLALGDSYTIGEKVNEEKRWPVQLIQRLKQGGYDFQSPKIIARTGWRTDELLAAMDEELGSERYDLVSILIGVNNQYQGKSLSTFKKEFKIILEQAISVCNVGKKRVFVVGIPDYGVTPFGKESGKPNISKEISAYNEVCKTVAKNYEIPFYPITKISLRVENDPGLAASDGLHPSGKMYRLWVDKIAAKVEHQLKE